ncbi:unnamed protein product, partial [Rotaria magnacalcarata]
MSTTTEQEKSTVESPSHVSAETENPPLVPTSPTTDDNTVNQASVVEEEEQQAPAGVSSWFTSFGLSPNLTNQLTNLSSSFMQVTSKVSAAANTLVQKTLPQRPSSPNENDQTDQTTKHDDETTKNEDEQQVSDENSAVAGINKDLT